MSRESYLDVKPFPSKLAGAAALSTVLLLGWLFWFVHDAYQFAQDTGTRIVSLERARGDIVHLDEVLSMSTSMAAATGEVSWVDRYRRYEPMLDIAIKIAINNARQSDIADAVRETGAANVVLVRMENRAFELIRDNNLEQARAILSSGQYSKQKEAYAGGMKMLLRVLQGERDAAVEAQQSRTLGSILAIFAVVIVILIFWLAVFGRVRAWKAVASKNYNDLVSAEEALRKSHETLEQRVVDRTQALEDEIAERRHAENELTEKESQLQAAMNNMAGGMFMIDEDLKFQVFNDQYSALFDLPKDVTRVSGSLSEPVRFRAERGDYGPGEVDELVEQRLKGYTDRGSLRTEETLPGGRVIEFHRRPTDKGGFVAIITDITERKKAEQELTVKESQLRAALDNMPVGMVLLDQDLNFMLYNGLYSELFGFPQGLVTENTSIADTIRFQARRGDYGAGDEYEHTNRILARYRSKEATGHERQLPNGRTMEVRVAPIADGGVVSVVTDITERKEAEVALRESEEQAKAILNTAFQLQGLLKPDGTVIEVNAAALSMIDGDRESVIGLAFWDCPWWMHNLDLQQRLREAVEQAADGETVQFLATHSISGRLNYIDFRVTPVRDENGDVVLLVPEGHDITELKQAEEALRESEARFQSVLSNMPAVVFLRDREGRFVLANERYDETYSIGDGEIRGKTLHELLPQQAADEYLAQDREVIESGQAIEFEAIVGTGTAQRTLRAVKFPINDDAGNVEAIGGIEVDITERKKAEQALAEAHELITSSVGYASNIQRSALPDEGMLREALREHFVIWEPRDVVGGDIYWLRRVEGGHILVVADCTGHGVPGAFLTMIATGALRQAIIEHPDGDPAKVLEHMNSFIKNSLRQDSESGPSDDGLELGVCKIGNGSGELIFAGARFSLWKLNGDGVKEIKGDKSAIGYRHIPIYQTFTDHVVEIEPGTAFYMFSDGFNDQVGGEKRRALGKKRIVNLLLASKNQPMEQQRDAVLELLRNYQGNELRRDDTTMIGFKL